MNFYFIFSRMRQQSEGFLEDTHSRHFVSWGSWRKQMPLSAGMIREILTVDKMGNG